VQSDTATLVIGSVPNGMRLVRVRLPGLNFVSRTYDRQGEIASPAVPPVVTTPSVNPTATATHASTVDPVASTSAEPEKKEEPERKTAPMSPPTAPGVAEEAILNVTIRGKITNVADTALTSKDSIKLQRMVEDQKHSSIHRSQDSGSSARIGDGTFSIHAKELLPGEYLISTTGMCLLAQRPNSLFQLVIKPNTSSGAVIDLGDLVVTGGHGPCKK